MHKGEQLDSGQYNMMAFPMCWEAYMSEDGACHLYVYEEGFTPAGVADHGCGVLVPMNYYCLISRLRGGNDARI